MSLRAQSVPLRHSQMSPDVVAAPGGGGKVVKFGCQPVPSPRRVNRSQTFTHYRSTGSNTLTCQPVVLYTAGQPVLSHSVSTGRGRLHPLLVNRSQGRHATGRVQLYTVVGEH
jgi:hypothetical protein